MSIEDDIALLQRVPSLAVLGPEALRVLAIGAESRTLHEGEALFYAGDHADAGYVVEEGLLRAVLPSRNSAQVTVGRGTLLGEMSLITETRRPATVFAAEPSSVMRIPRTIFLKMLQGYPEVAERLRQALMERMAALARDLGTIRQTLDISDEAGPKA